MVRTLGTLEIVLLTVAIEKFEKFKSILLSMISLNRLNAYGFELPFFSEIGDEAEDVVLIGVGAGFGADLIAIVDDDDAFNSDRSEPFL